MFPAPFKIRVTARVIARYVYSRCSWIGIFPSCCVDSLLAQKLMLWQTWRELFVVEDGEIIVLFDEDSDLVVRRQLDDLLLRQIKQNYHGIPMTTCSQTTSMCWIHLWWKVNCFWKFLFQPIFGETIQLFSFWQKLCSTKSDFLVSPTKTAILLVDLSTL